MVAKLREAFVGVKGFGMRIAEMGAGLWKSEVGSGKSEVDLLTPLSASDLRH